jgi:hypothetical protein
MKKKVKNAHYEYKVKAIISSRWSLKNGYTYVDCSSRLPLICTLDNPAETLEERLEQIRVIQEDLKNKELLRVSLMSEEEKAAEKEYWQKRAEIEFS